MAPQKKDDKQLIEVVDLDTLNPIISVLNSKHSRIADRISVVELEKQKRINIYHYVVHFLAIIIIVSYVFLVIYNQNIPNSYLTIVSIVIGFYFAKSLFRDS